jgi:hypothetical protein
MGGFVTVTGYGPERVPPLADGASCVKRCWGKGFATEAAFGAPEYAWEKLPPAQLGADPAVTALTDSRGKLIKVQIEEKLRSGFAAPQGSVASGPVSSNPACSSGESVSHGN